MSDNNIDINTDNLLNNPCEKRNNFYFVYLLLK